MEFYQRFLTLEFYQRFLTLEFCQRFLTLKFCQRFLTLEFCQRFLTLEFSPEISDLSFFTLFVYSDSGVIAALSEQRNVIAASHSACVTGLIKRKVCKWLQSTSEGEKSDEEENQEEMNEDD